MTLGERGYDVTLAEASAELGGRVDAREPAAGAGDLGPRARLPRRPDRPSSPTCEVFHSSPLDAQQIFELGFTSVAVATGARWRRDGVGRGHYEPVPGHGRSGIFTPDDVMAGVEIGGPVVIYDTDHYAMGGVIAEALRLKGLEVTLVTPMAVVSAWTEIMLEQRRIQARLHEIGVKIVPLHSLTAIEPRHVTLAYAYTGEKRDIEAASVVLVTTLVPEDRLYHDLAARRAEWPDHGIASVTRIGDCYGPATIAQAVWSGHRYGRTSRRSGKRERRGAVQAGGAGPLVGLLRRLAHLVHIARQLSPAAVVFARISGSCATGDASAQCNP